MKEREKGSLFGAFARAPQLLRSVHNGYFYYRRSRTMRQVLKACQAARCRIGEDFEIRRERSPRRSIFNRLYGAGRFLRRPGNGTGPIGEGEQIGGFAEHISGSHEIRFYGRRTSSRGARGRERERDRAKRNTRTQVCDEDKGCVMRM